MKYETIKLKIQNASHREDMVIALSASGYKVVVEQEKGSHFGSVDYFVVFEYYVNE